MKQLNIQISGPVACGKTTIAKALELALRDAGYDVTIENDEASRHYIASFERLKEYGKGVDKPKVVITTVQTQRQPIER